jgi:hypothetical protein
LNATVDQPHAVSTTSPLALLGHSYIDGDWAFHVLNSLGIDVTTFGVSSLQTPTHGQSLQASWTPTVSYQRVGEHQAIIELTNNSTTLTLTIPFALYNFPLQINSVEFLDGTLTQTIATPTAHQPFSIHICFQNLQTTTIPTVFLPVMVGSTYLGAASFSNCGPGQQGEAIILCTEGLEEGNYPIKTFLWSGQAGRPLASFYEGVLAIRE